MKLNEITAHHKAIYFVDVDETLFQTFAKVKVVKDGKVTHELDNQEYNSYILQPGEEFDYHEFKDGDLFKRTSKPIHAVLQKIEEIHQKVKQQPDSRIILLTARADFVDKEPFLQTFRDHGLDIDDMYVHRTGNDKGSAPERKKKAIREYLSTTEYDRAKMVDDHDGNLDAFLSLKLEFPNIDFRAWLVTNTGQTTTYK